MHYEGQSGEDSWRTRDYSHITERFYVPAKRKPDTIHHGWSVFYHLSTLPFIPLVAPFLLQRIILDTKGTKASHKKAGLYALNIMMGILFCALFFYAGRIELFATGIALILLWCVLARKAVIETVANNHARSHAHDAMAHLIPAGSSEIPLEYQHQRIYGEPGGIGKEVVKFGERNARAGRDGELKTARMLNDLVRIPGTRVFHGMRWPHSKNADIDHIAVNGDKIVLIDSKIWSGVGHYVNAKGEIITKTKNGSFCSRGVMKFPHAVESMSERYPGYIVRGMIAVHAPDGTTPSISKDESAPPTNTLVADAELAIESIAAWFAQDNQAIVDMGLLEHMKANLK